LGLMTAWAGFTLMPTMSQPWRLRVGFSSVLATGALLALYPTIHDEILCSDRAETTPETCPKRIDAAYTAEEREKFVTGAAAGEYGFGNWLLYNLDFRMVRGLDLKGGLRLVYNVDVAEAIRDKRDRYFDDIQDELVKAAGLNAGETVTDEEREKLRETVTLKKPANENNSIKIEFQSTEDAEKYFSQEFIASFQNELSVQRSTDGLQVTLRIKGSVASELRGKAVAQAKDTISRRIDSKGVKEAAVSPRDEDIIVEIPGDNKKAFQEIRDIISKTARLEFKLVDDSVDFLQQYVESETPKGVSFEFETGYAGQDKSGERATTNKVTFATIKRLEGESMEEARKRFSEWTKTLEVDDFHELAFEKDYRFDEESGEQVEVGWRTYYLKGKAELTGDMVRDATAYADQGDSGFASWKVTMDLDRVGARIFCDLTTANVKRRFAIILDGNVMSAPQIREKICGGSAQISMGNGGMEQQFKEAKQLELVLRSGALPAPISLVSEQRIGASLGNDAIDQGLRAAGIGAIAVLALMLLSYRRAGLIANFAVLFNLFLQLTVLSMFSASMTLPGIAGLALTVGMAVDANVLINERIREELEAGKVARAAVAMGYEKAFSAIVDGNATTLISGLILAQYGTGPIKGFAVALIVGMLCNLFTGVVVTRLFFEFWVRGRRNIDLGIGKKAKA
ncbi:MAG: protein translocase subunit SecD, partial [Myxococcota bacterium]